jgi:hypothetical protein
MAFTLIDPLSGVLPIASIDSGYITPGNVNTGSTTTVPTTPLYPGMVVKGFDPTYGVGEFILLAGVSGTAVGSLVTYNTTSFTTALCPTTQNLGQPVAVSMAANTAATTWSWYQIEGVAVVRKAPVVIANNVAVASYATSTGKIGVSTSGRQILGARSANSTVSATTTAQIVINRPHLQGRVT